MKILAISNLKGDKLDFVRGLLSKQLFVDKLFESVFFDVTVSYDDPDKALLFRKLYENVYLRRGNGEFSSLCFKEQKEVINLKLSLSEAIGYIYTATPPIKASLIPESITTEEDIISNLEFFLTDKENTNVDYTLDLFIKHTRLCWFDSVWRDDTVGLDLLYDYNKEVGMAIQVRYIDKTTVDDFMNHSYNEPVTVSMLIRLDCKTKIPKYILDTVSVDSVTVKEAGYYINCYHTFNILNKNEQMLVDDIKRCYGNIK